MKFALFMTKNKRFLIFINICVFAILMTGCFLTHKKPDISKININMEVKRFEKDLFNTPLADLKDTIPYLKNKYPDFFELFNVYIINIGKSSTPTYTDLLLQFVTYYGSQQAYKLVEQQYSDFSFYEDEIEKAFRYYKYYLPDKKVPDIVTFIAGFQQSVVIDENLLAIGLDNYLGRDCELYQRLGISQYIILNMHKDKIVPDAVLSWIKTEFPYNDSIDNILSNMIYYGKVLYATGKMLPGTPDSLIMGYTNDQMNFCFANENKMWTYLVDYKMLFKSDKLTINKLINDGPFTNDFSRKSPARAVTWLGWRIVDQYMRKNNVTLYDMLLEDDYMKIYNRAVYSP